MSLVHVIAEAGTNHNGYYGTAQRLVDEAAAAGADSVKFQLIYPEGLYLPHNIDKGMARPNPVFQKRQAMRLSDDEYRQLAAYCRNRNIMFGASVFDERGLALLDELGPGYIKIASCDLNNSRLLMAAAERGRQLVVSTGMASLQEIERAVSDLLSTGNTNVILMHCVSIYPCPTTHTNLHFVRVLKEAFGLPVGFSDHTERNVAAAGAVSLGATWIEKHLTLDRSSDGFDHAYAYEPSMFTEFVADLRAIVQACQEPRSKVRSEEAEVRRRARRGLYAARAIHAGATLNESDVLVVRPEGPLSPNALPLILGKRVTRTIQQYEPLAWEAIESPLPRQTNV